MYFDFRQHFAAPVDDVAKAFCDPDYYAVLAAAPKLGAPEVLSREEHEGQVILRVRYRFAGDLAPAARAVLDPAKLTWVDESTHDLASRSATFVLRPDHYPDRLAAHGSFRFDPDPADPAASVRAAQGEVKVHAPFVASSVERAIISGLKEHLDDEVTLLEGFLARR